MRHSILLGALLVLPIVVKCQSILTDSGKIYPLAEIVITATRSEKNPLDVGKSITLIPHEQISDTYFNNISELLSVTEGIFVVGSGQNFGMNQAIFLRGSNSNQTSVMIDDIRITDPSVVNNSPDVSELSLSNIDRIEIVRGTNSVLYGSSSVGGVINILSRKKQKDGLNAEINVDAGSFGRVTSLFRQNLFLNYSDPTGIYLNVEVNNENVKGIDATIDTVVTSGAYKNRDQDGFIHQDLIGKIGFINNQFDLYASYKRTHQKIDLDKRAYVDDDNYKLIFSRDLITYGLTFRPYEEFNIKFIGGYSAIQREAIDDSSVISYSGENDHTYNDEKYAGSNSTNDFQLNYKLPYFEFLLGGSFYNEAMTSKSYLYSRSIWGGYETTLDLDTLNLNSSTKGIYFHSDINAKLFNDCVGDFNVSFGFRLLDHSSFGSKFVYDFNPTYKINESALLYASYATGFNAPSLYQLYSPNKDYLSGITRGNFHLKPEYSTSFEIGFKQSIAKSFDISVDYFETRTDNLIEYVYLWDKNIGLDTLGNDWRRNDYRGDTYLNLGNQFSQGIEFSFSSEIRNDLKITGNVCLVNGKLRYSPEAVDTSATHGNHVQIFSNGVFMNKKVEFLGLTRRPSTANLGFVYSPQKQVTFRADIKYIGPRGDVYYDSNLGPYGGLGTTPVAGYTLVDLSSKISISDQIKLGMMLENIFNTKYEEIKGFSTRGRGLFLNIRYSI
jgi:vitamin B12 transporter